MKLYTARHTFQLGKLEKAMAGLKTSTVTLWSVVKARVQKYLDELPASGEEEEEEEEEQEGTTKHSRVEAVLGSLSTLREETRKHDPTTLRLPRKPRRRAASVQVPNPGRRPGRMRSGQPGRLASGRNPLRRRSR
jgi:hypothetical protein